MYDCQLDTKTQWGYNWFQPENTEEERDSLSLSNDNVKNGITKLPLNISLSYVSYGQQGTAIPDCIVLRSEDVSNVRGGSGRSAPPPRVNVKLSNVPYIFQEIANPQSLAQRSNYWCGIASALMVRSKSTFNDSMIFSRSSYEHSMEQMDNHLKDYYLNYGYRIDVVQNGGLLYISSSESNSNQYTKTKTVLTNLYKPSFYDGVWSDQGLVSGIAVNVYTADDAINAIWNHIYNNKQPAVIIIDSNKLNYITTYPNYSTPSIPTLH
jgi:hypothetical protein